MPELPEVETVRRGLSPVMEGRVIEHAAINRPNLRFAFPDRFRERLEGQTVTALDRRAKYLLAHLSGGETLLMHLGMSGRFTIVDEAGESGANTPGAYSHPAGDQSKHDHVIFRMSGGVFLIFNDARRFGFMTLFASAGGDEATPFLSGLGPEPLGNAFSPAHLDCALAGKRTPIKSALLDQRVVAGLGNIYVCEALWRAGISPKRLARTIPGTRSARLVPVIRDVLNEAITAGGTTLRDFKATDGALGYFQHSFAVYGRESEPCRKPECGGTVSRLVQAGRSTFFCAACQR
ncbi:MAG: DNA-formamidopyrimidine glycosylase [Maricaulis sp.]|jgi:formamidopyrimidine-DNA glycosylase|nr:DNA-formamidopyrimidine glycosylase [Maricaulis sp.]HAQ34218.1 DNA-formamidopyrimidine glycosylase [Alphaproteobacteria bacterium]